MGIVKDIESALEKSSHGFDIVRFERNIDTGKIDVKIEGSSEVNGSVALDAVRDFLSNASNGINPLLAAGSVTLMSLRGNKQDAHYDFKVSMPADTIQALVTTGDLSNVADGSPVLEVSISAGKSLIGAKVDLDISVQNGSVGIGYHEVFVGLQHVVGAYTEVLGAGVGAAIIARAGIEFRTGGEIVAILELDGSAGLPENLLPHDLDKFLSPGSVISNGRIEVPIKKGKCFVRGTLVDVWPSGMDLLNRPDGNHDRLSVLN